MIQHGGNYNMKMRIETSDAVQLKKVAKMLWNMARPFYTHMLSNGLIEVVMPDYTEDEDLRDYENLNRIVAILEGRRMPEIQEAIENMELMFDYKELPGPYFDVKFLLEKWQDYYKHISRDDLYRCDQVVFWLNEMLDNYDSLNDCKQILIYLFTIGKDKPSNIIRDIYQESSGLPLSFFK